MIFNTEKKSDKKVIESGSELGERASAEKRGTFRHMTGHMLYI